MSSLTQHIKTIAPLFFSLVFLASAAGAVPYTPPSGTYPANNTAPVVHTGTDNNIKPGGLSVNAFTAYQDAELSGPTAFTGTIFGSQFLSILLFGGYDSVNGVSNLVTVDASGSIKATGPLFSDNVATSGSLDPLCATPQGEVVFCGNSNPVGPICGNSTIESGEQCDDGNTTNGDGCSSSCQIESQPIAANNIGVYSQPVQGGTDDTNVICSVNFTQPTTKDETIQIGYLYAESSQQNFQSNGFCQLDVPAGVSYFDNYPGQEFFGQDIDINYYCYDLNSTVPRSPTMPAPAC